MLYQLRWHGKTGIEFNIAMAGRQLDIKKKSKRELVAY